MKKVLVIKSLAEDVPSSTLGVLEKADEKANIITIFFPLLGRRNFEYRQIIHLMEVDDAMSEENSIFTSYEKGQTAS